jgi:hypothetical protein
MNMTTNFVTSLHQLNSTHLSPELQSLIIQDLSLLENNIGLNNGLLQK